jgi:hypothetical protein
MIVARSDRSGAQPSPWRIARGNFAASDAPNHVGIRGRCNMSGRDISIGLDQEARPSYLVYPSGIYQYEVH